MHQCRIERRCKPDGLWEHGCRSCAGDAVESFVPPFVGWDVEPGNCGCVILELGDLLFQRHVGDEIGSAVLKAAVGVEVDRIGGQRGQGQQAGGGPTGGDETPNHTS